MVAEVCVSSRKVSEFEKDLKVGFRKYLLGFGKKVWLFVNDRSMHIFKSKFQRSPPVRPLIRVCKDGVVVSFKMIGEKIGHA